jgi:ABC-type Fe3+/spermidine/putrescine transport system ATPase subunit
MNTPATSNIIQTKMARAIAAQFYVSKGLHKNPAKMIKFIRSNTEYFPHANSEWINQIMKETNITEEDISKEPDIVFADLHTEEIQEAELKAKANKLKILRATELKKRDYGHGVRSMNESDVPSNIYTGDISMEETNEEFSKLKVNLKNYAPI